MAGAIQLPRFWQTTCEITHQNHLKKIAFRFVNNTEITLWCIDISCRFCISFVPVVFFLSFRSILATHQKYTYSYMYFFRSFFHPCLFSSTIDCCWSGSNRSFFALNFVLYCVVYIVYCVVYIFLVYIINDTFPALRDQYVTVAKITSLILSNVRWWNRFELN
jgi:hypothetical protein